MEKCKYCNQTKGHKMSCPTQKIVVNISKVEEIEEWCKRQLEKFKNK